MNGTMQAGLGYLALTGACAVLFIRYAVTGGTTNRRCGPRAPRRIEVEVRGRDLIPALAYGAAVAQTVAYCRGCRASVPVTVHGDATRCDAGHLTTHTTTGVTSR